MTNAERVVKLYKEKGLTFGFAESLTGGMISSEIVGVPGASEVFSGSVVCYTNDVKRNVLGVPETVIGVSENIPKSRQNVPKRWLRGYVK